jgi:hypothetical protein
MTALLQNNLPKRSEYAFGCAEGGPSMNLPERYQQNFLGALLVCLVLLSGLSTAWQPSLQVWGRALSGLQMTIYIDQAESTQSKVPKFKVELRNHGETDLVLNFGAMLGNGRKQYPSAVDLSLTDAQGKSRRLDLLLPSVAGRLDPFVLPLPAGAAFSIPVVLDNYIVAEDVNYKPRPGTYFLEAQFTGRGVSQQEANLDVKGIALMPYWTSTVASNRVQFEVSRQ